MPVFSSLTRIMGGCLLVFLAALITPVHAADEKPVVIAIAPFYDFSGCARAEVTGLRDKVTANLLQNYHCTILSRSNGMTVSVERQLGEMNSLEEKEPVSQPLPAADYSLVGYFKIARQTPGRRGSVDLGCTLLVTDLNKDSDDNFKKIEFIPNESNLYAADVTAEIVKALHLKPRTGEGAVRQGKIDETWAVLPVKRNESTRTMSQPPDRDLAAVLEMSLQQSGKLARLVDRGEIDKVMEELKISAMGSATETVAANVARLVGADKIVMGAVSKERKGSRNLRLDLFLVDGKKAVIITSATAVCNPDDLSDKAAGIVLDFVNRDCPVPSLNQASSGSLKKEVTIYSELLSSMTYGSTCNRNLADSATPLLETIYLLAGDDQMTLYKTADIICDNLLAQDINQDQIRKFVALSEKLLAKVTYSEDTRYVLLTRALVLNHLPDRIDEAVALAKKQLKDHPQVNPGYTRAVIAECYFKKKDYTTALKWAQSAEKNNFGIDLRTRLYPLIGNPETDRKELDDLILYDRHIRNEMKGDRLIRKLRLMARLESPEAALRYSKRIRAWAAARPEVQLEIVKLLITVGKKDAAGTILANLDSKNSMKKSGYKNRDKLNKLREDIKKTREALGVTPPKPKKLSEFYTIPDKYKLYVIPLGKPDMTMIHEAIPAVKDFLGCDVVVLPRVPLPDDPSCFKRARGQYDVKPTLWRLRNSYKIPDDTIGVAAITDKDIFQGSNRFVYSSGYYGFRIISYQRWYGAGNHAVLVDMLAKAIVNVFLINTRLYGCPVNSCMSSSDGTAWGIRDKDFSLCPFCQKKLKELPATKVHDLFRERYEDPSYRAGNSESEKTWTAAYTAVVQEKVKQAEQKPAAPKPEMR